MVAGLVVETRGPLETRGPFLSSQNGKGRGVYVEAVRSKKGSNIALQCWRLPSGENSFVEGKLGKLNRLDVDSSSRRNCCR